MTTLNFAMQEHKTTNKYLIFAQTKTRQSKAIKRQLFYNKNFKNTYKV